MPPPVNPALNPTGQGLTFPDPTAILPPQVANDTPATPKPGTKQQQAAPKPKPVPKPGTKQQQDPAAPPAVPKTATPVVTPPETHVATHTPGAEPNTPTSGDAPAARPPQAQASAPRLRNYQETAPAAVPTFQGRAPAQDYGGGIPPEAQALVDALSNRGRVLNDRTLESELLSFGGGDEASSPMARFEALRGAELGSELNSSLLGILHQASEAGRGRRHEANLQDQSLHTQRYLSDSGLAHGAEQGYQQRQHGRATQDTDLATRRFLAEQDLDYRYSRDDETARQRQQELLLALLGLSPSQASQGKSGSGGFSVGL